MRDGKMINETLRLLRLAHGLTGKDLAPQIGLSPSYLSEIESGKKTPSLELLQKYSEIFDVNASTLLFFAEELDKKTTIDRIKFSIREWLFELLKVINSHKAKGQEV